MASYPREADFINADGVKWWHEEGITKYAKFKGLNDVQGWFVELPSGEKAFLLTQDGHVIHDQGAIEACGVKIDILSASQS